MTTLLANYTRKYIENEINRKRSIDMVDIDYLKYIETRNVLTNGLKNTNQLVFNDLINRTSENLYIGDITIENIEELKNNEKNYFEHEYDITNFKVGAVAKTFLPEDNNVKYYTNLKRVYFNKEDLNKECKTRKLICRMRSECDYNKEKKCDEWIVKAKYYLA